MSQALVKLITLSDLQTTIANVDLFDGEVVLTSADNLLLGRILANIITEFASEWQ